MVTANEPLQTTNGNRWSALLALLLLVPVPTIGVVAAMHVEALEGTAGKAIFAAAKFVLIGLPAAWLLFVDKGRMSLSPVRRGGLGVGALLGLAISAVIVLAYFVVGHEWIDPAMIREEASETGLDRWWAYLAFAAYTCTVNAVLEEYVWRWFVFRKCQTLVPALGGVVAVGLSAALFTVHHVFALQAQFGWEVTVLASCGVFIGGAIWSWCYARYRSIWPGYVSHVIVDITIFVIGWMLIRPS